jgi:L-ribulose-5-phosphate 3-epimerase UlaE
MEGPKSTKPESTIWTGARNGKRQRLSVGRDSDAAHQRKIRKLAELRALSQGLVVTDVEEEANKNHVKVAVHDFLEEVQLTKQDKTWRGYKIALNYFQESCDKTHLEDIQRIDPAKAIEKYHDRLLFLHLKDVQDIPADTPKARYPFEFVELGRGRVDFPSAFAAMEEVKFRGWTIVELDRAPDKSRTPKESAIISKDYLEQKLGRPI